MSEWLHITGNIRLITRDVNSKNELKKLRNAIGKKIGHVQSYWSNLESTKLPSGSEGSLEWSLTNDEQFMPSNPNVHSLQNVSLTIHGNLRDVSSLEELEDWLNNTVTNATFAEKPHLGGIDFGVVSAVFDDYDKMTNYNFMNGVWKKSTVDFSEED